VFGTLSNPYIEKYETGLPRFGKSIMVRKKLSNRTKAGDTLLWAPRKVYDFLQRRTNVASLYDIYDYAENQGCDTIFDLHSGYIPKVMLDQISPDSSVFFYVIKCSEDGLSYDFGELGDGREFSFPRKNQPKKEKRWLELNNSRVNREIPKLVHETGIPYVRLEMLIPQNNLQEETQKASFLVNYLLEIIKNQEEIPLNGTV